MMYLGTLGRMVGIKCPTTQRVAPSERYTFNTTLGGQVKAQTGPGTRRVWDVGLGDLATPAEVGVLMEFATGAWGAGPFWFVSADAPVVNMLPPDAATCSPETITLTAGAELLGSPPLPLDDGGTAPRSAWTNGTGTTTFGQPIPVLAGQLVTGSAWVIGVGRVRLVFVNAQGVPLAHEDSTPAEWSSAQRLAVTTRVPHTAVAVQLAVTGNITQAARPAITWTDQAFEWGDGQGCPKAVVHNTSRDVLKARDDPHTGRWSAVSFTIQEVG